MTNLIRDSEDYKAKYILCIDDEAAILEALATQLADYFEPRYQIECAEGGLEALEVFDAIYAEHGRVALVVCDQLMPGMLGQYVLEQIHQRDARVMKVLLTGQAGLDAVTYAINHAGLHKYIEKPWDRCNLILSVENLLKQSQMAWELDLARKRYQAILHSMTNGVVSLDFHGQITSFNQAAATILGVHSQDTLGKTYFEIFFQYPGNEELNDLVLHAIETAEASAYRELDFLRRDDKRTPLGVMISILQDTDHSNSGVLIVLHDLSQIRKYSNLKEMFSRYVARPVVEKISNADDMLSLRGEKRAISILFSDIRGFTSMTEQLEPTDVVATLNAYFSCMIDVIYYYEGTLDKFLGDGIMCIFGAPLDQPDHAIRAARTALAMQRALLNFNRQQTESGKQTLEVGIGINSGDAVVGNVGSEKRLEYTAIGDNVNLAARLQAIAQGGQILLSASTYQAIQPLAQVAKLQPVRVKGKMHEVQVYELLDLYDHE